MAKTRYGVTRLALGNFPFVEISRKDFEDLKFSQLVISETVSLEEKFYILVDNYLDLEREIFNQALIELTRGMSTFGFRELSLNLNRRLVNLLTTTRLYIDHSHKHGRNILIGKSNDPISEIKKVFNKQFENNFGFRVLEALRNSAQHSNFPIHSCSSRERWVGDPPGTKFSCQVEMYLQAEKLKNDKNFNKKTLKEIEQKGGKLSLSLLTRSYVYGLFKAHKEIQALTEITLKESRARIDRIVEKFLKKEGQENKSSKVGVGAVMEKNGVQNEQVSFVHDLPSRIDYFREKNQSLPDLSKTFISTEINETEI